jgi:hypothetical protein
MSTKHTPGPWANDLPEHEQPYQDICIQAGKRGICRVWIDDAPLHDYNAEQFANARLIAAAPDLLAALAEYVNADPVDEELNGRKRTARAAIAKAIGGAA